MSNSIEKRGGRTQPAAEPQSGWAAWYAARDAEERDRAARSAPPPTPLPQPPEDTEAAADADVVAEAVRVMRSHGVYLVIKRCPFCGKRHAHGVRGPNLGDGDGWRVPHCCTGDARPQYFVREVEAPAAGSVGAKK